MIFKFIANQTNTADLDRMLKQMDDWSKTPIQGPPGAEFGQKLKRPCNGVSRIGTAVIPQSRAALLQS
jgi:hypothetical protein